MFVADSVANPEIPVSMPVVTGSTASERLRAVREGSRTSSSQEKETSKKATTLNTSYSSEELLFQAASSLQGLEGKNL